MRAACVGSGAVHDKPAHIPISRKEFTDEARQYWLEERGVSLRLSAKVLQAIKVLEAGTLKARLVHGVNRLHAKVFVGAVAATVGSSNFTGYGLSHQFEANARFEPPANVGAIKSWSPSPRTSGKPGSPGTPNFVHSWRSYFKSLMARGSCPSVCRTARGWLGRAVPERCGQRRPAVVAVSALGDRRGALDHRKRWERSDSGRHGSGKTRHRSAPSSGGPGPAVEYGSGSPRPDCVVGPPG